MWAQVDKLLLVNHFCCICSLCIFSCYLLPDKQIIVLCLLPNRIWIIPALKSFKRTIYFSEDKLITSKLCGNGILIAFAF